MRTNSDLTNLLYTYIDIFIFTINYIYSYLIIKYYIYERLIKIVKIIVYDSIYQYMIYFYQNNSSYCTSEYIGCLRNSIEVGIGIKKKIKK